MKLSTKKHLKSAIDTFLATFLTVIIGVLTTTDVNSLASMDRAAIGSALLAIGIVAVRALIKPAHTLLIEVLTGVKNEVETEVKPKKFKVQETVIEASVKDGQIKAKKIAKKPVKKAK